MNNTATFTDNLTRIELVPPGLKGFERFITSYVFRHRRETFLIDIGPASTAPALLGTLETMGITQIDYILLTHIHLDHAGAAGHLARAFPKAKIVCHPSGVKHLHQPDKLWQGSLKVLKHFALAYHEPLPVPLEQLLPSDAFGHDGFKVVATPGHAPHHLSFAHQDCLFIGEAAGIFFNLGAGYLRPATPLRFMLTQARASLDVLAALRPQLTAFAHHGVSPNGLVQIEQAQKQLELWVETARRIILQQGRTMRDCMAELLQLDPLVQSFNLFNAEEQQREREFFENALTGLVGWLKG